ncbi:MAG: phytoene desaturase family protein [Gemmatimonadaceae bacterium]
MTKTAFDAIVIGGGVAGLATAALMAKRGWQVALMEAREQLGGLTSTEELMPGLRHDIVDHELGWVPDRLVMELDLTRHGLELLPLARSSALIPPGEGECISIYGHNNQVASDLKRFSAKDAQAWVPFARRVMKLSRFLNALYDVPAPSLFATGAGNMLTMLALGRRARSLGRQGMFDVLRTLPMSIADMLDETFENPTLKGLLAARGVSRILQGPKSGATAFLFLHHHVGGYFGSVRFMQTARGGVGALVSALAASAKASGVTIRTGTPVAQVAVRNDGVRGVVLESGEEVTAEIVVSSLDPRRTIHDLIDPIYVEPELSRAIGNVRLRGAAAKVNLVLDGAVPMANAERMVHGTLVVAPSMSYLERAYDCAKHGAISEDPALEIRVPSAMDPSLRNGDRVAISVLAQWMPYHLKTGTWDSAARDALGDTVLRTLERFIPGLTSRVLHRQVLSPLDIEQRYGASEGSLTHGELALDQILFMRPVPALSRYRYNTIAGLFLSGRGCHPGMPLPAAMLASREILRAGRRERAPAAPPAA